MICKDIWNLIHNLINIITWQGHDRNPSRLTPPFQDPYHQSASSDTAPTTPTNPHFATVFTLAPEVPALHVAVGFNFSAPPVMATLKR